MTDTVSMHVVSSDEAGLRIDRWVKLHYPGLGFGALNKLLRTGQIRVDGGRVKPATKLASGQKVRIPPIGQLRAEQSVRPAKLKSDESDRDALERHILHIDDALMVINKPYGLAVQGGSGLSRHVDGMLEAFRDKRGQKPRLVHRLDRETSGVLLVARTRKAAAALATSFRARETRKIYWALSWHVPKINQGKISTYLARGEGEKSELMLVAQHGDDNSTHAISSYSVVDQAGQRFAWLSMRPVTGRTHQLRVHAMHMGHPLIGDSKYFNILNWELPSGFQNRLHLFARRLVIPHPDGGLLDVSAPLPAHMQQSWAMLGFDANRFDVDNEDEEID